MGVEVGVQMWKVVPEGRVWVLWLRPVLGSGFGAVDVSGEGAEGVGGFDACLRYSDGTFNMLRSAKLATLAHHAFLENSFFLEVWFRMMARA